MADTEVFIGKDVLRLVTTAMYDNPLLMYREYIQNAIDAIDSAVNAGLIAKDKVAIRISLDRERRSIVIRDTGAGVVARKFRRCMTSIGWSEKKHTPMRGLWGIGRLAGLVYCQNLVFKTKAYGENVVSCIEWDGKKFKEVLSRTGQDVDFSGAIQEIVTIKREDTQASRPGFFEVQVNGVVRHRNDVLLNEEAIREYIGQIAPVPFHADAPFPERIIEFLSPHVDVSGYKIFLNQESKIIYRPHRKTFPVSIGRQDDFSDVQCFEVTNGTGKPIAIGWILHHSYLGAIKSTPAVRGLRVRSGNMQIGDESILSDIFPEPRFNGWTVGELHIIDSRIMPNGQRNNFEDTLTLRNIKSQLVSMVGRVVAKKCRENSAVRNKEKMVKKELMMEKERLAIINQNVFSKEKRDEIIRGMEEKLSNFQAVFSNGFPKPVCGILEDIEKILEQLRKSKKTNREAFSYASLPENQKRLVSDIVGLIYDNSANTQIARQLIERITSLVTKNV